MHQSGQHRFVRVDPAEAPRQYAGDGGNVIECCQAACEMPSYAVRFFDFSIWSMATASEVVRTTSKPSRLTATCKSVIGRPDGL